MFEQYKKTLLELAPPHKVGANDICRLYREIKTHMSPELLLQQDAPILQIGDRKSVKLTKSTCGFETENCKGSCKVKNNIPKIQNNFGWN